MNHTTVNASSSAAEYYWAECMTHGPSTGLIVLMTTYCFELLVGAPSNIWLIWHILKKRSKVAGILPADFFPFHEAFTQVLFYTTLPMLFVNHFLWQSSAVLDVISFLNSTVLVMKPLLQCLVCVERYMAVVRPLDYLRFKGHQYRWGCLVAIWFLYILISTFASSKRSVVAACAVFLPVLAIDTFCSLSVLRKLKQTPPGDKKMMMEHRKTKINGEEKVENHDDSPVVSEEGKQESNGCKEGGKGKKVRSGVPKVKEEMNSIKKKAFNTIIIIQAILTLNYLPFIIAMFIEGRVPDLTLKCQYAALALAAATSCSYLHPLLYLHRLGRLPCMSSQNT